MRYVATYLNIFPSFTLRDAVERCDVLDPSRLERMMTQHASGVTVLACPRPDQRLVDSEHASQVSMILELLKAHHDFTLIDAGRADGAMLHVIFETTDIVLLIGSLELLSLKGLFGMHNRLMNRFQDRNRIKVIINRYNAKCQLPSIFFTVLQSI